MIVGLGHAPADLEPQSGLLGGAGMPRALWVRRAFGETGLGPME